MNGNSVCETCGKFYTVPNYRLAKTRFCSKSCRSSFVAEKHLNKGPKPWAAKNLDGHRHKSANRFKAGHKPWNKNLKGIHLSPDTEFKKGRDSENRLPFGTVTIREDKAGSPRAWMKTLDGWKPRAQVVFAAKHGAIPAGHVVHHKDGDTLNDRPKNLMAVTPADHARIHRMTPTRSRSSAGQSRVSPTMKGRDASRGGKGPVGESLLPTTPALVVGGFSGGRT